MLTSKQTNNYQPTDTKTHSNRVEILQALTPSVIALIGGVIGMAAILTGSDAAAFGLAGTAIAGAAGLSQAHPPSLTQPRKGSPKTEKDNKL